MNSVGCQTSATGNGKYLMEIHDLQNIIAKFRVAMPDPTELSCAKAIAFFKPGWYGDVHVFKIVAAECSRFV